MSYERTTPDWDKPRATSFAEATARGRPKGSINRVTLAARTLARGIVESPEYRASLEARAKDGTLPPAVETMLWHYAFGRPKESVHIMFNEDQQDLSGVSVEGLAERAEYTARILREVAAARAELEAGNVIASLPTSDTVVM
jgi:hypothetical protein